MAKFTTKEWERLNNDPNYKLFRQYVSGWNFMTDQPVEYIRRGKYVIEISTESNHTDNVFGDWLFGVTIVDLEAGCVDYAKNTCFSDEKREVAYQQCIDYINKL